MSDKLRRFGQKVSEGLNGDGGQSRRRWQTGVALLSMALFVVASVAVNRVVLALNQAAGNYGYRSGSYGYQASATTSDFVPSAPTSLSASSIGTSSATLSWTAPTTTTGSTAISTGGGSIASYKFHYNTSSLSACSGGTSSTPTSATTTLSSLAAATTYYVAVCATDNNSNDSAALTGSFTTASSGGGGGGGSGSGTSIFTAPPATPVAATPVITPAVQGAAPAVPAVPSSVASDAATLVAHLVTQGIATVRNTVAEATNVTKVTSSATEFRVTLVAIVKTTAANFVTYGTSSVTVALGSGERLAVVRDLFETLGATIQADAAKLLKAAEEISSGQKPSVRNLAKERAQVQAALPAFRKLTGKSAPNFKNAKDDLAWNTILYRVRFPRNLAKERAGISKFRSIYKKAPKTPFEWAQVRAYAYALR